MINGGLGMLFGGDPTRSEQIAYGVVAGAIWLGWILVVVFVSVKGRNKEGLETEQVSAREKGQSRDHGVDSNLL